MLYFLGKLPLPPFEIKNFLPPFCKMGCKYHDIADQLAPKQILNLQTGQHVNRNLQKLLSKDLSQRIQTWDLWKQESIRKTSNWVETGILVPRLPSRNRFLVIAVKLHIVDVGFQMFIIPRKNL